MPAHTLSRTDHHAHGHGHLADVGQHIRKPGHPKGPSMPSANTYKPGHTSQGPSRPLANMAIAWSYVRIARAITGVLYAQKAWSYMSRAKGGTFDVSKHTADCRMTWRARCKPIIPRNPALACLQTRGCGTFACAHLHIGAQLQSHLAHHAANPCACMPTDMRL